MSQPTYFFGVHAVLDMLKHQPHQVLEVFLSQGLSKRRAEEIQQAANMHQLVVTHIQQSKLDTWTEGANHQGVVAKVRWNDSSALDLSEKELLSQIANSDDKNSNNKKWLLLILDGVQDPHNLGACFRSSEAFGVDAVIVPKHSTVKRSAVVSKVACGADQKIPLVIANNLAKLIDSLKEQGVWVIGASHEAKQSISQHDFRVSTALVLGGEGQGIRRLTQESCDALVTIPMMGSGNSLNVSVATGICLYEIQRQRK